MTIDRKPSESALATTAEQARYRIDYPNSQPRVSRIIALDERGLLALKALQEKAWNGARFLRYLHAKPASETLPHLTIDALVEDFDGNRSTVAKEAIEANVIIMVASSGEAADAAAIIGNACAALGKPVTGLVLAAPGKNEALSATLQAMRPHTTMLVVSTGDDYVGEMLTALRA